jgi:hypothetical protein
MVLSLDGVITLTGRMVTLIGALTLMLLRGRLGAQNADRAVAPAASGHV